MRICASLTLEDIVKDEDRYIAEFYMNDKKDKFVLDVTDLVEDKISEIKRINIKDNDRLLLKFKVDENGRPIANTNTMRACYRVFKESFKDHDVIALQDIFNVEVLSKEVADKMIDKLNDIRSNMEVVNNG